MDDQSGLTEEEKQMKVAEFLWDPEKLVQKIRDEYDARIIMLETEITGLKMDMNDLTNSALPESPLTKREFEEYKANLMKAMFTNYPISYPYGNIPQS